MRRAGIHHTMMLRAVNAAAMMDAGSVIAVTSTTLQRSEDLIKSIKNLAADNNVSLSHVTFKAHTTRNDA